MKHILLSIFLLLGGSVWGQTLGYCDKPSTYTDSLTVDHIRDLIRAEIERWWEEKNKPSDDTLLGGFMKIETHTAPPTFSICPQPVICDKCGGEDFIFCCREDILHKCQPEPLKIVIDTVRANRHRCGWDGCDIVIMDILRIDTLYDLTPEQVEKLR